MPTLQLGLSRDGSLGSAVLTVHIAQAPCATAFQDYMIGMSQATKLSLFLFIHLFILNDYMVYMALHEVASVHLSSWSYETAFFVNKKSATLAFFHLFQCSKWFPIPEPWCTLHLSEHRASLGSYPGNHLLKNIFADPSDEIRTHLLLTLRILFSSSQHWWQL